MTAARWTSALHDLSQVKPVRAFAQAIDSSLARATTRLDAVLERNDRLPAAIDADRHEIATADAGTLVYYADTKAGGRPLVLLHGIHAAASSYEMKPLFDAFRAERSVYALDLPGFGFSERAARPYAPATYIHAIEHLLRNVSMREPVDVVALSLTSEYVAKVALEMPELVRSLVFLSPTGFTSDSEVGWLERLSRQRTLQIPQAVSESLPSRLAYELLVSKPSLRYFLRKSFEGAIDEGMLAYAYATGHQPGAYRAPMAFLTGALFPRGQAANIYGHVHAPSLVLYDRDPYASFDVLPEFAQKHPNYRVQRIAPTRGLPQFDAREQTVEIIREFFEDQEQRRNVRSPAFGAVRVVGSA